MKKVIVDFSNVKYFYELQEILKEQMGFPDWYGKNPSALWDMISGEAYADEVHIRGIDGLPGDIKAAAEHIYDIFTRAELMYGEMSVVRE